MNYFRLYYNIINNAHLEKRKRGDIYYESHHVKPLCKGGKFEVLLTAREHFICHLILTKIYPNDYQLTSAFNKMFSCSQDQNRYMPVSRWFEYRRRMFSKNHPCKNEEIKKKISKSVKEKWLESGQFVKFVTCIECGKLIIGRPRKYCNRICQFAEHHRKKTRKICPICNKKHNNNICCSKKCFYEYIKISDNKYSDALSKSRSNYIKNNKDKIIIAAKKCANKVNHEEKGKKISKTKKKNNSGNNNASSSTILIYDQHDNLIHTSEYNFKEFCQNNDLPYIRFCRSYQRGTKMTNEYKGWYAIKIN